MGQLVLNFMVAITSSPIVAATTALTSVVTPSPLSLHTPSVTRTPAGFRVVLAPGLTSKSAVNPCASCSEGQDREYCSEFCTKEKARLDYLESIGVAGLVSGNCEGDYCGSGPANDVNARTSRNY